MFLYKKGSPKSIFLDGFFFWKISVGFWHRKLTLKVQCRHFLTNHNSLKDCFKTISFEHVDCWAKSLQDPPSLKFHKPTDIITNPLFYEKTIKQTNYFLHQVHMPVQNSCWFIICENLARLTFYFKNLPPIFEVTRYILKKSWNQNVHIFTLFTEKEKQRKC